VDAVIEGAGTGSFALVALGLVAGMVVMLELGRRLALRRSARDPEGAKLGHGAVEGSIFGLLGLLVAFTFSGAASRFDVRRALAVEEANAIGTAYARLDMLPDAFQPEMRGLFRRYVDTRLEIYRTLPDLAAAREALARADALQAEIWRVAVAACKTEEGRSLPVTILPPLNAMFDNTTSRTMAFLHHPPLIVFILLVLLALISALLAGYGMAGGRERSWMHMVGFAAVTGLALYVILDLEFPRFGLIRVGSVDSALEQVRRTME
jgi:hypothetical protein